jgi:hypothetical protein
MSFWTWLLMCAVEITVIVGWLWRRDIKQRERTEVILRMAANRGRHEDEEVNVDRCGAGVTSQSRSNVFWVVRDSDLTQMLQEVAAGDDPMAVYWEHYANSRHDDVAGEDA